MPFDIDFGVSMCWSLCRAWRSKHLIVQSLQEQKWQKIQLTCVNILFRACLDWLIWAYLLT